MTDETATLFPVSDADLTSLRNRLTTTAEQSGDLDVSYDLTTTPIGTLLVAATAHGVVRVAFESEDFDTVLDSLAARIGPNILRAPEPLATATTQLREYFAGQRRTFDVPLDYRLSSGFRQSVQQHLLEIGYGHTATYKAVAELVGRPTAVRAVGTACATNPLPILLPCHRVLRSDGGLGGYLGGLDAKTALLDLESAA
ncbi:methylated-DNA--[protein]-cysteine S-methyltransferase [Citricoccus sp. NR2]|uniref:methylated-DNA--[protein]-cysteine S-methyltransferase n=1 Tax=Citricoccus sp. NR2 TaxID=3004095 RepID=UPI0022DD473E|nr:methylated-DNA--[protein]-cysteine S-methyltransferase [Citricoccus sp. NR2]WBL19620.1 methylated-DNA--[protein]-cysteine S-methyltransferase [Citricoccus sp. NR2]